MAQPQQLTGTIQNKREIPLDGVFRITFLLLARNMAGQQVGIDCHAWGEDARELNRRLSDGCVARVTFAQQKNTPALFASKRAISAEILERISPPPPPVETTPRVPVAWGLWRSGKGWFRGLKRADTLVRRRAISYTERDNCAMLFLSFDSCRDQQQVLTSAFGCRMTIKPLKFR
jgi:hypothetical protein